MNRRVLVNLSVFVALCALMVGWAVTRIVSFNFIDNPYRVSAEFPNAFGVVKNAEVTYRGVAYGSVTGVDLEPGAVVVHMMIDRDKRIPADATAHVLRKSVIGEPYVDFEPPDGYAGRGGPYLASGARVPMSRTTVPLEFSEMLRSASALIASIPPDDVQTLVHEAAVGLQGRTESLRALAESGDRLSSSLAAKTEVLDRLATNQTRITKVLADHRSSLGQSLSDLRQLADSLKSAKGDTSVLLERGAAFMTQTADLVAARKADLDCDLKVLEQVVDLANTKQRLAGLRVLLDTGPAALGHVWEAMDEEPDGRWIRIGNISNGEYNPPKQYTPPKPLPDVRPVPACHSTLRASGVDYRPASASRSVPAVLLRSAGASAAGVAGAAIIVLAGLVAARRVRARVVR